MSLVDWRRQLEADPHRDDSAIVSLEVVDAGAAVPAAFRHRLRLDVQTSPLTGAYAELDYYALGELIDQLREAAGVLLALQGDPLAGAAILALERMRDTPHDA